MAKTAKKRAYKKRKYTRSELPGAKSKAVNGFDINSIQPEDGIFVTLRTENSRAMFEKMDQLNVGQSYRLPMDFLRDYVNAKNSHKLKTNKVFVMRKLDKYNIRVWRIADDAVLRTSRKKK